MSLFHRAARNASRLACVLLAGSALPAFAQLGAPAADPVLIESQPALDEPVPLAQVLSPGGRVHRVWLRESFPGSSELIRSVQRPPYQPGPTLEDPFLTYIAGAPLLATGSGPGTPSFLVQADPTGSLRLTGFGADGGPSGAFALPLHGLAGPLQNAALASDRDGQTSALVWSAVEADGHAPYVQILSEWGVQGMPLRLGSGSSAEPVHPRVAALPGGEFVVVWAENDPVQPDWRRLRVQRVDAYANALGPDELIEEGPADSLGQPDLASSGWSNTRVAYVVFNQIRMRALDWGVGHAFDLHWLPPMPHGTEPPAVRISADTQSHFALAWVGSEPYAWPEVASLEALWVDAWGQMLAEPRQLRRVEARPLQLVDIDSDADGDLHLVWSEGEARPAQRTLWTQVFRGSGSADVQIEALHPDIPIPPGLMLPLDLRIHNFAPNTGMAGENSASGLRFSVTGLTGGWVDPDRSPQGFSCLSSVDRLDCTLDSELEAGSVMMARLPLHSPDSEAPWQLQVSVSAHQYDANLSNNEVAVLIERPDNTPDPFAFPSHQGVPGGSQQVSEPALLDGFDDGLEMSISGGEYSLDGGTWSTAPIQIAAGSSVRLRHTASTSYSTAVTTTLRLGTASASFTSTTAGPDVTPEPFSFPDITGAKRSRTVTSTSRTLVGFAAPTPISISGGTYSRNGGAFTSTPAYVIPGDRLRLRVTSSSQANTAVSVTVTVGGVSDTWTVTTGQ
jgi:hypothetical protein